MQSGNKSIISSFFRGNRWLLFFPKMETREFPNPYPDWPTGKTFALDAETRQRIVAARDHFLHCLEHPRKFAEYLGIKGTLDRAEDDVSVYTGSFIHLGSVKVFFSPILDHYAAARIDTCCQKMQHSVIQMVFY
jgi:hypothetical protein